MSCSTCLRPHRRYPSSQSRSAMERAPHRRCQGISMCSPRRGQRTLRAALQRERLGGLERSWRGHHQHARCGVPQPIGARCVRSRSGQRALDPTLQRQRLDRVDQSRWILSTAPAVVSSAPNTLDVFAAARTKRCTPATSTEVPGAAGRIWVASSRQRRPPPRQTRGRSVCSQRSGQRTLGHFYNVGWSNWVGLGGVLTTAPGAASRNAGELDVFARGQANDLWSRTTSSVGSGGGWVSLGGVIASPPAAVSANPGTVQVFARGQDAALWANSNAGGGFAGWCNLGGVIL